MSARGFKGPPVCPDFGRDPEARCNRIIRDAESVKAAAGISPSPIAPVLLFTTAILAIPNARQRRPKGRASLRGENLQAGEDRPLRTANKTH